MRANTGVWPVWVEVVLNVNRGYTVIIIIIATFAKVFPAYVLTKMIVKETHRFSLTVGILMNTRGLVELIALNVALQFVSLFVVLRAVSRS